MTNPRNPSITGARGRRIRYPVPGGRARCGRPSGRPASTAPHVPVRQRPVESSRCPAIPQLGAAAGTDRVATAHTRRDQAETVLLRLARGGGAGAVAGVRRSRPLTEAILLVRPLLEVPREATEAYCRASGLPTVQDAH